MGRSGLHLGLDEDRYHFPDGAHRWAAPVGEDQQQWEDLVRAHIALALLEGGCHEAQRVSRRARGVRPPEQRRVS